MFFVRIDEWGWDEAPARVPMFPGDLPRQDHPLPKALDDAAAAKLLRAAHNDKRLLVRVTVEVLLRTGLRVSEFTALPADAVVQIGAAPWLHVPVGKLREDRYLPLHPQLVDLIDEYRTAARPARASAAAAPRERAAAGPAHRHPVHQQGRRRSRAAAHPSPPAAAHPGHPGHQPRHDPGSDRRDARAPQLDMTLRYAKIANRTVAEEYFAVTDKVDALYAKPAPLPADAIGPNMARLAPRAPPTPRQRLLHPTTRARLRLRVDLREPARFFQTSIEFRPTLQAQHDDAARQGPDPPSRPLQPAPDQPHGRRSIMSHRPDPCAIMPMSGRGGGIPVAVVSVLLVPVLRGNSLCQKVVRRASPNRAPGSSIISGDTRDPGGVAHAAPPEQRTTRGTRAHEHRRGPSRAIPQVLQAASVDLRPT